MTTRSLIRNTAFCTASFAVAVLPGCRNEIPAATADRGSNASMGPREQPQPQAKPGALPSGRVHGKQGPKTSDFPPEARRDSAPRSLAESALAVGSTAPSMKGVPSTPSTMGLWSGPSQGTLVVFYRGHW